MTSKQDGLKIFVWQSLHL